MTDAPKLRECIKELTKATEKTIVFFAAIDRNDIPTLAKAFKQLSDQVKDLEETFKILASLQKEYSYEVLPDAFENAGIDSVKLSGHNFIMAARQNCSIIGDKKDEAHDWLKENGYSALIQPAVNPKTLSSAMKSYTEEKALNPPDDLFKTHRQRYISVRKS